VQVESPAPNGPKSGRPSLRWETPAREYMTDENYGFEEDAAYLAEHIAARA
jgi:hypothetical protein